jgi:hypothetical protein
MVSFACFEILRARFVPVPEKKRKIIFSEWNGLTRKTNEMNRSP